MPTWLLVILIVLGGIFSEIFFGSINKRIQSRRCKDKCSYGECAHDVAIVAGYIVWPLLLGGVLLYELAVGRAGVPAKVKKPRLSWAERKAEAERAAHQRAMEKIARERAELQAQQELEAARLKLANTASEAYARIEANKVYGGGVSSIAR